MEEFSIASATVSDCSESARILVQQLAEHRVDASAEQLSRVLEKIVADAARGFVRSDRAKRSLTGYPASSGSLGECCPAIYCVSKARSADSTVSPTPTIPSSKL